EAAKDAAREAQSRRRLRAQARFDRMKAGPYLESNAVGEQWIVIPSAWFNPMAKNFWNQVDARFSRRDKAWVRVANRPYDGKSYTPAQWLRSLRRKFFEFYGDEIERAEKIFAEGGVYRPTRQSLHISPAPDIGRAGKTEGGT
ncbi:MAG: hypothetical protein DRJ03_21715, partial [Chloroflexi bacterium]